MKFLVLAATCLAVAVAGPTRGSLFPDTAGPIVIEGEDINNEPALIPEDIVQEPEDISVGPALVDEQKSALVQVIININNKNHVIDIPVEDASIPEIEDINVGPAMVDDEIEPDNVLVVDSPLPVPADLGTPELPGPGLDADNAQNIPEELN